MQATPIDKNKQNTSWAIRHTVDISVLDYMNQGVTIIPALAVFTSQRGDTRDYKLQSHRTGSFK